MALLPIRNSYFSTVQYVHNHLFYPCFFVSLDCYIINREGNNIQTQDYQIAEAFSYEIWLYLTFIILPLLYFTLFYYTRCKLKVCEIHMQSSATVKLTEAKKEDSFMYYTFNCCFFFVFF